MVGSIRRALPSVVLALLACGCVEVERVITLNPDGRGKFVQDALILADAPFMAGPGGGPGETLDQKKQKALLKVLAGKGITACKDVSAEWAPDGRLHLKATLYFERLEDLGGKDMSESYQVTRPSEGVLKIALQVNKDAKKKPLPDLAKMSEKDLDEFLLQKRVAYQSQRPLLVAMLTDLKLKTVLEAPGDVTELKGFKKAGDRAVVWSVDGNAALKDITRFMAQDNATLKKKIQGPKGGELLESFGLLEALDVAEVTVKVTGPRFDYAKEVAQARAAYPALRQQLKLDAKTKLPGAAEK
jgi:hypothetical protein